MSFVKFCWLAATILFGVAAALLIGVCLEWVTLHHPVAEALVASGLFFCALAHD